VAHRHDPVTLATAKKIEPIISRFGSTITSRP
jgi:hypothetical protein